MLSKLSRFLAITTLTTLTCLITHSASAYHLERDAKLITQESTTQTAEIDNNYHELNLNQLIDEAFWQNTDDFYQVSEPISSHPVNETNRDGLLIYTIVTDYYKQLQPKQPTSYR